MPVRTCAVVLFSALLTVSNCFAEKTPKPNINESKEFANVFHSPSADSTPPLFQSVFRLEIVKRRGDSDAQVQYADAVVIGENGLLATVVDEPGANTQKQGGIESATVLFLDGAAKPARLLAFDSTHGVAILRVADVDLKPLPLSTSSLVAKRRLEWCAVFNQGKKTFLYSRPLQVHKARIEMGDATDLCEIIDFESSSLNADRSGSALVALDGSLVALMGYQPHWNVSPKSVTPRTKVAWAVPASVLKDILATIDE